MRIPKARILKYAAMGIIAAFHCYLLFKEGEAARASA